MPTGVLVGGGHSERVNRCCKGLVQSVQSLPGIVWYISQTTFVQEVYLEHVIHHALVIRLAVSLDRRCVIRRVCGQFVVIETAMRQAKGVPELMHEGTGFHRHLLPVGRR